MPQVTVRSKRKQDQQYWDTMAAKWDDEIFNTLHHDKGGVIASEITRSSRGRGSVGDFGCGIGIYFPLLTRLFDEVQGFERSLACVRIASDRYAGNAKISVYPATAAARRREAFDVVLCVNVAIHPSVRGRSSVFRAVWEMLRPGGTLILVVPSFESAAMVAMAEAAIMTRKGKPGGGDWDVTTHPNGVVAIEGLPTKHFTKGELDSTLSRLGWDVKRIRRVEYSWKSQGVKGSGEAPWDWIAVATKG